MVIYQFVAELKNFKPRMWRRFVVTDDMKLSHFAYAVMHMFGCQASHLFALSAKKDSSEDDSCAQAPQNIIDIRNLLNNKINEKDKQELLQDIFKKSAQSFVGNEITYQIPNEDIVNESEDIRNYKVLDIFKNVKDNARLEYDFGDSWEFKISLEKILEDDAFEKEDLPLVLKGKVRGIIEDCGGPWYLQDLVERFQKSKDPNYCGDDLSEDEEDWYGEDLEEILYFDVDEVNGSLLEGIEDQKCSFESEI